MRRKEDPMQETKALVCVLAVAALGLAAIGATGCSQVEAAPFEVTYYYLPG
jgi:hypothetical protein